MAIEAVRSSHKSAKNTLPNNIAKKATRPIQLSFDDILQILPQKPPFVMVDRVLELESKKRILASKNTCLSELRLLNFQNPSDEFSFPKTLICEAIGQVGIIFFKDCVNRLRENLTIFLTSVDTRFSRKVRLNEKILIEISLLKLVKNACILFASASINGELVAEGTMSLYCVLDRSEHPILKLTLS